MKLKLGLMSGFILLSGAARAAEGEGLKVGGFVDAQYNWQKQTGSDTSSFGVHDGALYLGKTMGMGEVMVDIPFAYSGTTNEFKVGKDKAQAFVSWKYENGFGWKMGQFDSLYGAEANDSVDNVFSGTGKIKEFMPTTHTGLQVSYEMSDLLGLHLVVANSYNNGAQTAGKSPDFGFKLASKFDTFKASVGGLFFKEAGKSGYIIDVNAGTKFMDKVTADLEVVFDKARDTAGTAVGADTRFSGGITLGYMLMEKMNVATGFEYLKVSGAKTIDWVVGPQWWMNKDAVIKVDYRMSKKDGVETEHKIGLAAVHKF